MMWKRFISPLFVALAVFTACASQPPPAPEVVFEILPKLATYTVGQRVTAKFTIDFGEAEPTSQISPAGLPDSRAAQVGEFRQLDSGSPQKLIFAADMILLAPGVRMYAPDLSGQMAVRVRSASFMRRNIFPYRAVASPVELNVEAPPLEGRPDDWSGAVGDYRLDAGLAPRTCRVGDLLTLKWSLIGRGTAGDVSKIAYKPGRNFRVYPSRVTSQADGVVSCSHVVIPLGTNVTEAAAFHLSVFNPVKRVYETLSAGPFALTVRARDTEIATSSALPELIVRNGDGQPEVVHAEPRDATGWMRVLRRRWGAYATVEVESSARLAPAAGARVLFNIPAGTSVEIRERHGDWARVLVGRAAGWVPGAVLNLKSTVEYPLSNKEDTLSKEKNATPRLHQ